MNILSVADVELPFLYSPTIKERFSAIDLIISCGDLPYYYLEYIISNLDRPLYYVNGNHTNKVEITSAGDRTSPWGGINLHRRVVRDESGLLLAGLEGSLTYNYAAHQYSQEDMWLMVFALVPAFFSNRARYGRYLDLFISHAPPRKVHDMEDRPHQGFNAFNWLNRVFQPAYHLHGHIHVYRQDTITETLVGSTQVVNTYGFRVININLKGREQNSTDQEKIGAKNHV